MILTITFILFLENNKLQICLQTSFLLYSMGLPGSGLPGGSDGKESVCSAGDLGSIPGLGRSPGQGNGYLLQCSGLENYSPWGRKESDTLSDFHFACQFLGK